MALKVYVVRGATFQFEEGNQPPGAVEYVPAPRTPVESVKQARKPKNKKIEPEYDK